MEEKEERQVGKRRSRQSRVDKRWTTGTGTGVRDQGALRAGDLTIDSCSDINIKGDYSTVSPLTPLTNHERLDMSLKPSGTWPFDRPGLQSKRPGNR